MNLDIAGKNIFIIKAFLSEEECCDFINQAESIGFKSADVDTGKGRSVLSHIRNNERVTLKSSELAAHLWRKLDFRELPAFEGKSAKYLSPYFRFYKYTPGQKFNMHKDGRQHIAGHTSYFTLLVYLNQGYDGGHTIFRQDSLTVAPGTGKALIFEHHLWHQGQKLDTGTKYVLRTDIVYGN